MIVTVKRTGGYAGIEETVCRLDTATLPQDRAKKVAGLIKESNFFSLTAEPLDDEIGADLYRYEITVSEDDRCHSIIVTVGEGKATTSSQRLLESILNLAQRSLL